MILSRVHWVTYEQKGVNIMPEKQNAQRTNVNKEELSIEQRKHKEQNEHRRFEEMSNKKLDGPNRPAE
jgi:hypothetical protein